MRDDTEIDALVNSLRPEGFRPAGPHVFAAAEGHEVELSRRPFVAVAKSWLSAEGRPRARRSPAGPLSWP